MILVYAIVVVFTNVMRLRVDFSCRREKPFCVLVRSGLKVARYVLNWLLCQELREENHLKASLHHLVRLGKIVGKF